MNVEETLGEGDITSESETENADLEIVDDEEDIEIMDYVDVRRRTQKQTWKQHAPNPKPNSNRNPNPNPSITLTLTLKRNKETKKKGGKLGGPTGWYNRVVGGSIPPAPTIRFMFSWKDREIVEDKKKKEKKKSVSAFHAL